MFSKKSLKKAAALFLSVCMLVSLFTCLTVITAVADEAIVTETAAFIGNAGENHHAAIFIPVDIPKEGNTLESGNAFSGEQFFKLVFKCKMLSGTKPVVGVYRIKKSQGDSGTGDNHTYAEPDWCDQATVKVENGVCTADVKVDFDLRRNPNGEGFRSFYLVIGNSYYDGANTTVADFNDAFIMSDVKLLWIEDPEEEPTDETNVLPSFTADNINFDGTYFFKSNGCDNWDSPLGASAMKWHLFSSPDVIKEITVPADYNTADSYGAANFIQTAETDYTREYYTNENYEGLYFGKLKNSDDAGFEIISRDVNKKMVIIDANHEGEEDVNTKTGKEYAPKLNRAANIFLPISYGHYAMSGSTAQNINFLVKVTFNARQLEGSDAPVIGRLVGKKGNSSGRGSQGKPKSAHNIAVGDYFSDPVGKHDKYYDGDEELTFKYNAETGEFEGWMRVRCADNNYSSRFGVNEIITIGNSEHVYSNGGKFDSTAFNTSFAISDIKVDLYACSDDSDNEGGSFTKGELIAEDIAPHLTADTLDTNTCWAHQYTSDVSNHARDCIRAPQNLWSAEGNVGMVHTENLTPCIKEAHTLTHNAATDTTREYWSCSCGKNYKESYAKTEITDLSAKNQMIYIAASENPASVFIPLKLSGYENYRWFKFTCKAKSIGGEAVPVISTLYAKYDGTNACEPTVSKGGGINVWDYSYDAETQTLTAYIKAWIKDTINQGDRYPFERMNPISGANVAIVLGNGTYVGAGYSEHPSDTDFAFAEPELYMLDCDHTEDPTEAHFEAAKAASEVGENLIAPMTDKTIDLEAEYVATWTNANNPVAAPVNNWYRTGADKVNVTVKNIPKDYFTPGYVECTHESTTTVPAVASTCCTQGHGEYTVCNNPDCAEILEGSDALLPLDPDNHEGETETRNAVPATCVTGGYSGDTYCLGCGNKIADGEVINATGVHTVGDWLSNGDGHWHFCTECEQDVDEAAHTYEWVITKVATAEENGLKEEICSVCGYKSGNSEEVVFTSHKPGDINGDGEVDNKDLTRLFQHLSNWDVEVNEDALDVNGDGSVDNKDLTRLFQYLSNWEVEIF